MKRYIVLLITLVLLAVNSDASSQSIDTTKKAKKKAPKVQTKEQTVYVTKTGSKYHSDGCRYLRKSQISISLSNAKASYDPCSVCDPPR